MGNCKISELRRQLESMQALLDTYEHCHVDSVTPEEKIVERVKAKCVEDVRNLVMSEDDAPDMKTLNIAIKAIQGV